jgi:hypothetical protein
MKKKLHLLIESRILNLDEDEFCCYKTLFKKILIDRNGRKELSRYQIIENEYI